MSAANHATALDAEKLYAQLQSDVPGLLQDNARLVGVASGGYWLAERLQRALGLAEVGTISSAMHRDDYARRGLASSMQTDLPFEIDGADIVLLDDVLFTGRTVRAVLNELFDYGRPKRVRLAVLVDRGGRQLPVSAEWAAARIELPADQSLRLARESGDRFRFSIEGI